MAEIKEVQKYQESYSHSGSKNRNVSSPIPGKKKKPARRELAQIKDAATVLGIPRVEFTPRVQEAITYLLKENEGLRKEVESKRHRQDKVIGISDKHDFLPISNRRFIYQHITEIAENATTRRTFGYLLIIKILDFDGNISVLNDENHETYLRQVIQVLEEYVPDTIPYGYLEDDSFGFVLTVESEEDVLRLGENLCSRVEEIIEFGNELTPPKMVRCGYSIIKTGNNPRGIHLDVQAQIKV